MCASPWRIRSRHSPKRGGHKKERHGFCPCEKKNYVFALSDYIICPLARSVKHTAPKLGGIKKKNRNGFCPREKKNYVFALTDYIICPLARSVKHKAKATQNRTKFIKEINPMANKKTKSNNRRAAANALAQRNARAIAILGVIVVLLIGVLVASICMQGFTNPDPFGLFAKDEPSPENPGGEDDVEPEDVFVLNPISTQFVKLLATAMPGAPYDEDHSVHLTATVEPENAEDKTVDWTIAFANPSSEWATGKTVTEYVTVTPTENGSLEADVKGLKAFGEQIVVTCTSRANPEAKATCTVDYIRKYTLLTGVSILGDGSSDASATIKINRSDGTIDATNTISYTFGYDATAYAKYTEIFKKQGFTEAELMKQSLSSTSDAAVSGLSHQIKLPLVKSYGQVYENYTTAKKTDFYKKFFAASAAQTISNTPEKQNKANVAIKEWLDYVVTLGESKSVFTLSLTLKSKNEDHSYSTTSSVSVLIESAKNDGSYASTIAGIKSSIKDAVSGVEVSQGSIVF